MATLTIDCRLKHEQRPKWLKYLLSALHNAEDFEYEGSLEELDRLQYGLNALIGRMALAGILEGSKVHAVVVERENAVVVTRNDKRVMTINIK